MSDKPSDIANLRRMADERDGKDPMAALALSAAADEIDRMRAALDLFMAATSEGSEWGTYWRMESPELYTEISEARAAAHPSP